MPSVIRLSQTSSPTHKNSRLLSNSSSSPALARTSAPRKGDIWMAGRGRHEEIGVPVLIVSCDALNSSERRTVLPLLPYEPNFENTYTHLAVAATSETGLEHMMTVDTERSRSMQVEFLIRYVGYVPAELMVDITSGLHLVLGCE